MIIPLHQLRIPHIQDLDSIFPQVPQTSLRSCVRREERKLHAVSHAKKYGKARCMFSPRAESMWPAKGTCADVATTARSRQNANIPPCTTTWTRHDARCVLLFYSYYTHAASRKLSEIPPRYLTMTTSCTFVNHRTQDPVSQVGKERAT